MDFRGFDSSIILILRGGIPGPIGNSPESLSQATLVGIILVGRLGVDPSGPRQESVEKAKLLEHLEEIDVCPYIFAYPYGGFYFVCVMKCHSSEVFLG